MGVKKPPVCYTKNNREGLKGWYIPYMRSEAVPQEIFLDPILGGQTYLWFLSRVSHMVLGMMVFCPWYFVDLVKGTTFMF